MKTYLLQAPSVHTPRPLFAFESGASKKRYASYSFRIGAATAAGSAGLPSWLIKTLGRWTSDCYERYIRTPQEVLVSVPYKLTASTKH